MQSHHLQYISEERGSGAEDRRIAPRHTLGRLDCQGSLGNCLDVTAKEEKGMGSQGQVPSPGWVQPCRTKGSCGNSTEIVSKAGKCGGKMQNK